MNQGLKRGVWRLCGALAFALVAGGASAAVIVSAGNTPQQGAVGVDFGSGCSTSVSGPASLVSGCLTGAPSTQITFSADENLGIGSGGTLDATDRNGYQWLRIALPGGTFNTVVLNIDAVADGSVTFYDGTNTSNRFSIDRNGSNYFTVTGGPFSFIEVRASADAFESIKNVRISGASEATPVSSQSLRVSAVPEPASLALIALVIVALVLVRRRSLVR